ncbi:hypothetical protein [Hyphomicrobium sp. LHD-15]|uniref:glycosyltransferase family 39 protein n=1 Tax=Hyphomicrobium sp. LHD-15 TaxID=3072142 RepID=UPI00280D41DE|nr:hypothetical protein [Hyphomicrobium sp. LHD-15]MDQ8699853.1 hypothetical protein [Hyphomicrobium sp. LHD-15]
MRDHSTFFLILFLTFTMRQLLSGQSYWYDELLSVYHYGNKHGSVWSAIQALAENSIHPPLYQSILYGWIAAFGDGETTTRNLSNWYVAGATVCLYALVLHTHGKRLAIAAALFFSLMYIPFLYAMETRSYAQTLFLVTLSSLLMFRYMRSLLEAGRNTLVVNRWFAALSAVNLALLLTHYYNVFFLAGQGVFFAIWFLFRYRLSVGSVLKLAGFGLTPVFLLAIVWGPVMARSYRSYGDEGAYAVEATAPAHSPWMMLVDLVVEQNFKFPGLVLLAFGGLVVLVIALSIRRLWHSGYRSRDVANLYFVAWLVLPIVFAYVAFWLFEQERYRPRYFAFCTPPLAVLLGLATNLVLGRLARWQPRVGRALVASPVLVALLVAAIFVLPGTKRAAAFKKTDHRGIAQTIDTLVRGSPGKRYLVYEVCPKPTLDYYFARIKSPATVRDHPSRKQEAAGHFELENQKDEIRGYDYLVLAFTHDTAPAFPKLIGYLTDNYQLEHTFLSKAGRGIMIFRVKSSPN